MNADLRERWGAQALQQRLRALEPDLLVEVVASIGSTNSALLEQATSARRSAVVASGPGAFQTRLLVAEQQTQGRGRQGRIWHALPGASLTFSLALALKPQDWSGLSLAVGVALADALEPTVETPGQAATPGDPRPGHIGLKWPNDLWLRDDAAPMGGRKLGGVLIETAPWGVGHGPRVCIIGVGLNVWPQTVEGASSGTACVQELQSAATAPAVLARVAMPLLDGVRRFEREGFAGVLARFARRDLLNGQAVTTTSATLPEGTACGVDATGALVVQGPDGRRHGVVSGEISVRPLPGRFT